MRLLAHLVRAGDGVPATILVTARDTEPETDHEVMALVTQLAGQAGSHAVRLRGLDPASVSALVADARRDLSTGDARDLAATVWEETAGNPLFVTAVLRLTPGGAADVDVSTAVRRRLGALSEPTQRILRTAALIGLEFDARVLAAAAAVDHLGVLDALDTGTRAGIIQESGINRFRFAHALIRGVLHDEVTATRRTHLHARIGQAIELTFARDLDDHVEALAYHYGQAAAGGLALEEAVRYAMRVGDRARDQVAFAEAMDYYQRALELDSDILTPRERCELLSAAGSVAFRCGQLEQSRADYRRAAVLAMAHDWPELIAEIAVGYADTFSHTGDPSLEGTRWLQRARDGLDDRSPLRPRVLTALGQLLVLAGRTTEGRALVEEAIEVAKWLGDDVALAWAYHGHFQASVGPDLVERRFEVARQLYDLAVAIGHVELTSSGAHQVARVGIELGRGDLARDYYQRAVDVGRTLEFAFFKYQGATFGSVLALTDGDLPRAEALAGEAEALGAGFSAHDTSGVYGVQMFSIRREQGRLAEAAPVMHLMAQRGVGGAWTPGLAVVYAELDMRQQAADTFEKLAEHGFADLPADARLSPTLSYLTDVCVYLGDRERADILYERLQPWANLMIATLPVLCYGPAARYRGMLALTLGRTRQAVSHFKEAIERADGLESPLWRAHSEYWLARASKDAAPAEAARATAERLGMGALGRRCRQLLNG